MEIILLTTDVNAFNATGQVFESAHKLMLTERQKEIIEDLQNKGNLITKIVLCDEPKPQ